MYINPGIGNFPLPEREKMIKYAVIGHPAGHSRSPGMHNAALKKCGVAAEYLKLDVAPEEFDDFVRYARENLAGFNLTVPHKQMIIPYLDEIDPEAERVNSVNTVKVLPDRGLAGCSTDGVGFEEAVRFRLGMELAGKSCLLLGCGGAARAVAFRLAKCGAKMIRIANRHVDKAAALAAELDAEAEAITLSDTERLEAAVRGSDLVIQATTLGLRADDAPPVALEVLDAAPRGLAVFDLIYMATPLLRRAAELGMRYCDGREMLLRQGAASFRFWTGMEPPIETMRSGMENDPGAVPLYDWRSAR